MVLTVQLMSIFCTCLFLGVNSTHAFLYDQLVLKMIKLKWWASVLIVCTIIFAITKLKAGWCW